MRRDEHHGLITTGTIRKYNCKTGKYGYCASNSNDAPPGKKLTSSGFVLKLKSKKKSPEYRQKHRIDYDDYV